MLRPALPVRAADGDGCHRLTYTSCQESRKYDSLFRLMARNMDKSLSG
jgi:hypothetical protein